MRSVLVRWLGAVIALFLGACGTLDDKGGLESRVPDVYFSCIDKSVPPETALKVLRQVLNTVPQLQAIRARDAKNSGGTVRLNLSLQSGPDRKAVQALERTHFFVYVNTMGKSGLISTYTFVVKNDFTDVGVFDSSGDNVISVRRWLAEQTRSPGAK